MIRADLVRARSGLLRLALVLAWLSLSSEVLFASRAVAQVSVDTGYKDLVEQALAEFKHKNWPEARVLFARAHELNPNARTSRGLGIVSFEMREYVAAVLYLRDALADARQPLTDAQRSECEALLTRARSYVGAFSIRVEPEGASVTVDGSAPIRDESGQLLIAFGDHTVAASASGYQTASAKLSVKGGEHAEISLQLPLNETVAARPAAADVENVLAPTPAANQPRLSVATGEATTAGPTRSDGLKYTWIAASAAVGFGGAAAVTWLLGSRKLDDLDQRCTERATGSNPCERGDVSTKAITRLERMTNAGLGLAAVSAVAAAVLVVVEWPSERRPSAAHAQNPALRLNVSMGPQSVSFRGAF